MKGGHGTGMKGGRGGVGDKLKRFRGARCRWVEWVRGKEEEMKWERSKGRRVTEETAEGRRTARGCGCGGAKMDGGM